MEIEHTTIIDALLAHAQQKPRDIAFKFCSSDQNESITWGELAIRAKTLASAIANRTNPGDRVLLVYAPGLEFISAFLACSMANAIAIPCFPPSSDSLRAKLTAIISDAQPTLALHDNHVKAVDKVESIDTTTLASDASINHQPNIKKEAIAFLQYSSGSTGDPKGVMINHSNIIANIQHIVKISGTNEETRGLCWMPHTHDMGLIGHILHAIYLGCYLCITPPSQMVRHPFSILSLLQEERLSILGMPNFACELCIKRIKPEQLALLNLSHLKTVIIGAEPINAAILDEFSKKFASTGFKTAMLLPAYGLAETTLMASAHRGLDTKIIKEKTIVNCGHAVETLKIVDPNTHTECLPSESGEVWLAGESVAQGYWNKPELTQQTFHATLAGYTQKYLRTGDIGSLQNQNLYIHGRIKEMMIFSGEKYFPQDIELTILQSDEQLEQQDCVVFSINEKGTEHLIAIIKVPRNTEKETHKVVSSKIRKAVLHQHQLAVKDIVLVTNTMPRTTSGKKQRIYCQKLYESQELEHYFKLMPIKEENHATIIN